MAKHHPRQDPRLRGKLQIAARQMRHEPTSAEASLWQRIRNRQLGGYKFHRQHLIGRYIVDFYCPEAALVIEVDGDIHRQQVEADQEREEDLRALGYRIVRFSNNRVLNDIDNVLLHILGVLRQSE